MVVKVKKDATLRKLFEASLDLLGVARSCMTDKRVLAVALTSNSTSHT